MSILLYGQKADRTHENYMLRTFIQAIMADWQHTDKDVVLIANSMWNGAEIDLICILPSAVLMVDFKDYKGQLTAAENGPWIIDGIEVKGGSKANPFHQLRDNKFAVMDWFKKHHLLQDRNVSHTSAAVIFSGPAIGKPSLSGNVAPWFHTTDMAHCASLLADLASPKLTIYKSDIDAIIRVLGVRRVKEDYGQANRNTTQPVISAAYNHSIATTENSAVAQAPIKFVNPAKKEPTQTLNIPPVEKKSLSGMFKTAVAVGGLLLSLAIVSQIYPTVGQSSTLTSDQAQSSVLPMQPLAQAVYTEKYTNSGASQIQTRAAAKQLLSGIKCALW